MDSIEHAPVPMAGGPGMRGPSRTVTAKEATERRTTMMDLMSNGLSEDELITAMDTKFSMTRDETIRLRERVKAVLQSEFDEAAPLHKALASRRIQKHILRAQKANQWGAVANLESQLSKIQGTESPTESHITVDARLQQATLHVLGGMSPAQVQELVAEELKRMPTTVSSPQFGAPQAIPAHGQASDEVEE